MQSFNLKNEINMSTNSISIYTRLLNETLFWEEPHLTNLLNVSTTAARLSPRQGQQNSNTFKKFVKIR